MATSTGTRRWPSPYVYATVTALAVVGLVVGLIKTRPRARDAVAEVVSNSFCKGNVTRVNMTSCTSPAPIGLWGSVTGQRSSCGYPTAAE